MTPEELAAAYQVQYGRLRESTIATVEAAWLAYGGISDAQADDFARVAASATDGAQQAVAALVSGYIATMTRQVTGNARPHAIPPRSVTTDALRGVPALEVYRRPTIDVRTAVSHGQPYNDRTLQVGLRRAVQLAEAGVVLAQREATRQSIAADNRIVGYRRTLTGESCALCATASTQRYHREKLHPIHVNCDCGIAPIYGTKDPGQVINSELLADLKKTGGPEYWKSHGFGVDEQGVIRRRRDVTVTGPDGTARRAMELGEPLKPAVRRHGELGLVLVDPQDRFTGPADLAA